MKALKPGRSLSSSTPTGGGLRLGVKETVIAPLLAFSPAALLWRSASFGSIVSIDTLKSSFANAIFTGPTWTEDFAKSWLRHGSLFSAANCRLAALSTAAPTDRQASAASALRSANLNKSSCCCRLTPAASSSGVRSATGEAAFSTARCFRCFFFPGTGSLGDRAAESGSSSGTARRLSARSRCGRRACETTGGGSGDGLALLDMDAAGVASLVGGSSKGSSGCGVADFCLVRPEGRSGDVPVTRFPGAPWLPILSAQTPRRSAD
mmetsp:Transcript_24652/g.79606  ORF Transcript_24652/g.79606 Transcript_24652/m.79606 type:complete len:265 (+) Transcript_24652:1050-1844(+)